MWLIDALLGTKFVVGKDSDLASWIQEAKKFWSEEARAERKKNGQRINVKFS